jgi:hypothetical protein
MISHQIFGSTMLLDIVDRKLKEGP